MIRTANIRRRTIALLGIFALVYLGLIGRMGWLQIYHGNWLQDQSFRYKMRPTPIQPDRGEILDRHGYPLVRNVVCESIFAQPVLIKNKRAAAEALAPILGMKVETLETRMNRPTFAEWLKRKVKPEIVEKVKALEIKGIGFAPEKCRVYPEGDLAAHVLGITNLDHHGIEGLELYYDKKLMGKPGAIQCEYTAHGQPMAEGDCEVRMGEPGLTLVTTLDIGMQRLAVKAAERARLENRADRVAIIVMDVKTGGLLALAQQPSYDPRLGGNSDPKARRIFTVADTLPPGSIFKPITASAALDSGTITAESTISDSGCMQVGGWSICNWDHKALGGVTIREVMAKSSNVGFGKLGIALGRDRFYGYHELFGLTRPTGIDLPGEAVGQWVPKKSATEIDLAIQAFGQTLTVSPIQMLTAIAAIANDGKLMRPHLASAWLDPEGNVVERYQATPVRQVVKPEVARFVQELMVGVVDRGTGKNARVPGYKIGGKTGTATKVIGGKVAKGRYIASFVGFAPYPDPQIAVLISVDEPKGAYYGGQVAAPIMGEVVAEFLDYLDIPPSKVPPTQPANPWEPAPPRPPEKAVVPSIVNLPVEEARRVARAAGFEISFEPGGVPYVTRQFPLPGATAYKGGVMTATTILPPPGPEKVHVPDLRGKSLRQAAETLALKGLLMEAEGRGVVTAQDPPAESVVPEGTPVSVRFAPPAKQP